MNARLLLPAVLLLSAPLAFAQDAAPQPSNNTAPPPPHYGYGRPGMGPGGPMRGHGDDHRGPEMHGGGGFRGHGMEDHGMWWKNPGLAARIGITADQQKKIDDVFTQSRIQLIDLHATLEKEELLLHPLMDANPIDQPKALAQIDKIAETRASLEKTNARMLLSIRSVLTPDQWTKLQAERHGGPRPGGSWQGGQRPSGRPTPGQPKPSTPPVE